MVLGTSEPLLGQMRLAWWRDQLGKTVSQRPRGDVLLDLLGQAWEGGEPALLALVDGWEALLSPRPLEDAAMARFVDGRAALATGLAERAGQSASRPEAQRAGKLWAFADLAIRAQDETERDAALDHGIRLAEQRLALPGELRPLAVIGGLARRSLRSGGREMLGDRFSPLVALRLGLFGR
ncbi:MAG: hypothetical protein JJ901_09960 [Erythrobacter sp.]|uniref:hypothetical protein n=1 Tax=Erythrobacter sp. TaxID=1042 RepID=UPI001B0833FD|nr:hypothetical protein [Erythrobacter sp.]MBO6768606.1 hypothetical protein [Erythrobacter sp.]